MSCDDKTWYIEPILPPGRFLDIYIRTASDPSGDKNSLGERTLHGTIEQLVRELKRIADKEETGDDTDAWESDEYDAWVSIIVTDEEEYRRIEKPLLSKIRRGGWTIRNETC